MTVGVLGLQGDFARHLEMLAQIGAPARLVKYRRELAGLDGLILPGGESTTMLKFLFEEELFSPLREFALEGGALFGTCAGAILIASKVRGPEQPSLGLLDIAIRRNAYGAQVDSHVSREPCPGLGPEPMEMVFIRAPIIEEVGGGVEVLARHRGDPVFVRQGGLLATTFHPELTKDPRVHLYFVEQVAPVAARPV
jgi:5'-phosphate synthase pdxT subunit